MDISSLRERSATSEITVSELNNYVKKLLDSDRGLKAVSVRGEISNLTIHGSGHIYFTLKDEGAQVKAVMFRSSASSLKFAPENGMKVIVRCSVSVYVQGGAYQLYVTSMQPDGIGALYLAYEQLKNKLSAEGLFDSSHKLSLKKFPSAIGVITSPTGAAIRDIINVLGRRYPLAKVYLYPALVQGEGAEQALIDGIDYFDKSGLADLVIIGRGGGSIEDLWAFNSERLARRIFDAKVPVISAVGHETDFTICDFVADMRAPTPSAAAEIAVPSGDEIRSTLRMINGRCISALKSILTGAEEELEYRRTSRIFEHPESIFEDNEKMLADKCDKIVAMTSQMVDKAASSLSIVSEKLGALSPLAVLSRGYAVANNEKGVIKDSRELSIGDEINIRFCRGEITARVESNTE